MKKFKTVGFALVAVFALCAFASSAFAASEWLVGGVALTGTETRPVDIEGELLLAVLVIGIEAVDIDCSGIFDGTVGPGAFDLIETLLNLATETISEPLVGLALSCEVLVSVGEECGAVGSLAEVWAENLPWLTEITLMAAAPTFLDLLLEDGKGDPAYEVLCSNGKTNLCSGPSSVALTNNPDGSTVDALFDTYNAPTSSEKANCTIGGAGSGDFLGLGTILSTAGLMLQVS